MALKQINVNATPAAKKKSDVPAFEIGVNLPTRLNAAVRRLKELEAEKAQIEAELEPIALRHLLEHNVDNTPVSSIKMSDDDGGVAMFIFQNKYSPADAEAADAVFTAMGEDINDYVVQTTKASFDNKFFFDADGNFDQAAYDEVSTAVAGVAKKLKKSNPLSYKTVVVPKPDFHELRFKKFNVENNLRLCEVLPNTTCFKEATL